MPADFLIHRGQVSLRYYAVVRVADGKVLYEGPQLWEAAIALAPGTCHGQADRPLDARAAALGMARKIRAAQAAVSNHKSRFALEEL